MGPTPVIVSKNSPVATCCKPVTVELRQEDCDPAQRHAWEEFVARGGPGAIHSGPAWLAAVCEGLQHRPYVLVAKQNDRLAGVLPLAFVKSLLFGRFLVSLPYINSAGVIADNQTTAAALIDRAVELADELDVRYLELRHETPHEHPSLTAKLANKVHMRLALPATPDGLWTQLKAKVRNQVRKGQQHRLSVDWGGPELLPEFYAVFSRNMRDLGTPVFGRRLFRSILAHFPTEAELCVLRLASRPIAAAIVVHQAGVTDVTSASSLRPYNSTNANMLMYWHLLQRAVERGQQVFDFGRSSLDSNTYRFKKQWGARPQPAVWQYYVRRGRVADMRIETGKYDRMVHVWQRLPVCLTRLIGPRIVRGIP